MNPLANPKQKYQEGVEKNVFHLNKNTKNHKKEENTYWGFTLLAHAKGTQKCLLE